MLLSMGAGAAGKGLQMIPAVSRFAKAAPSVAKLLNFATKPAAGLEVARTIQGVHQDGIQHLMHTKGMSEAEAATSAAPGAALAGVFSFLAGAPLEAKMMEELAEGVARAGSYTLGSRLKSWVRAAVGHSSKEAIQETGNGLGEDLAKWLTYQPDLTLKEVAANAVGNAAGGFAMGLSMGATRHGSSALAAQQQQDFFRALQDTKVKSELGQQAGFKLNEWVHALAKDGPMAEVFVPSEKWTTYWQSQNEDPQAKAEEMGVSVEDYQNTVERKGDLVIPTGSFAERLGVEHFDGLVPHLRTSLLGPTLLESEQTRTSAEFQKEVEKEALEEPQSPERDALRQQILADLTLAQAAFTGKQLEDVADGYARVLMVMAKKGKLTPAEILERNRLSITRNLRDNIVRLGVDPDERTDPGTQAVGPDGNVADSQVQGPEAGREPQRLVGGAERVREGLPGQGASPSARLWHGTGLTPEQIVALKAEGLTRNQKGGMGPGLHLSAGPQVGVEYAKGNPQGLWKAAVQNLVPFDAAQDTTHSVETLKALGFTGELREMTGAEAWDRLVHELGEDGAVAHLREKGFNGLYYNHGGEDAWAVWDNSSIRGSQLTTEAQALEEYARQGSRRDPVTGFLKAVAQQLNQPANVSARDLLRTGRRILATLGDKPTLAKFRQAMAKELEVKQKTYEYDGKVGDEAWQLLMDRSALKELTGAPPNIRTEEDRAALVEKFRQMALVGEAGRFWYDQSAEGFLAAAHGDRLAAMKMAALAALYSPKTPVPDNGRRAILAYYDALHDMAIEASGTHPAVKMKAQQVMDATSFEGVLGVFRGQKVSAFQQNLIDMFAPGHADADAVTIDIWMMRAAGFENEAPSEAQYGWTSEVVRDVAKQLGWKPKEVQAAVWIAQKAETEKTSTKKAGFHFGDSFLRIGAQFDAESMPTSELRDQLTPGIENATAEQLQAYHAAKMAAVQDALKTIGAALSSAPTGFGYWLGETNPVTAFYVPAPFLGGFDEGRLSQGARAELELVGRVLFSVLGDQNAIGVMRPYPAKNLSSANGLHYTLARELNRQEMAELSAAFEKLGYNAWIDAADPKNIKFVHDADTWTSDPKSAKKFHNDVRGIMQTVFGEGHELKDAEEWLFAADSKLVKEGVNENYLKGLPTRRASAVRAALRSGGEAVARANSDLVTSLRTGPGVYTGVHYSTVAGLTELDPARYGTGSPGAEAKRLRGLPAEQRGRTFFYEVKDGTLPAKEQVVRGNNQYTATLRGIYDLDTDTLGLKQEFSDLNALEQGLRDRGFRGYVASAPGMPARGIVVFGPDKIGVQPVKTADDVQVMYQGGSPQFKPVDTSSPEFKAWFGDSKVVDENGQPLVVYHGTASSGSFDVFAGGSEEKSASGNVGIWGRGVGYFGDRQAGSDYAAGRMGGGAQNPSQSGGPRVVPVYLSMQNPFIWSERMPLSEFREFVKSLDGITPEESERVDSNTQDIGGTKFRVSSAPGVIENLGVDRWTELLKSNGYDGVIVNMDRFGEYPHSAEFVAFRPAQIKSALSNTGAFDPNNPNIMFQPAYHGSPYKFDKFTTDKIGTGEGAQAYGWGLYFAGSRSVAEFYHENLASTTKPHNTIDGRRITKNLLESLKNDGDVFVRDFFRNSEGVHAAGIRNIAKGLGGVIEEARDNAEHFRQREQDLNNPNIVSSTYTSEQMSEQAQYYERKAQALEALLTRLGYNKAKKNGQLYKVEIPDTGYLLWDKPLSEQPQDVQDAVRGLAGVLFPERQSRLHEDAGEIPAAVKNENGMYFYWKLTTALGGDKAASLALKEAGLNGIKYLDGSSRGKGEGNYNYVIFDDAAVQVLETFYQPATPDENRGALQWSGPNGNREFNLALLKSENKSTVFHELGHFYLEVLGDLASMPAATQEIKDDYSRILKWLGVADRSQIQTEHHEKFADAHLAYLLEGKAPVAEMIPAFKRFSNWLAKLGAKLFGVNVQMSDEVRGIFDRLYATDEELAAAQQELPDLFATAQDMGVSQAEFNVLARKKREAIEEAHDKLLGKLMREIAQDDRTERRDRKKAIREEVTAEIDTRPEYQALATLATGEHGKLNRGLLIDMYGQETVNGLDKRLLSANGELDPDAAAAITGFEGGDALVEALTRLPARSSAIAAETNSRFRAEYPTALEDGSVREKAVAALNGDARGEVLAAELKILSRNAEKELAPGREAAARSDARHTESVTSIRARAKAFIAGKPLRQINPFQFFQAQQKASREAYTASLRKDYATAKAAQERALLNHHLFREAVKAKEAEEDFRAWVKRNDSARVRANLALAGDEYLAQFDALRDRFQIERESNKQIERKLTLAAFAAEMAAQNKDAVIDPELLDDTRTKNYREFTLDEMQGLWNALKNIKHLAYQETHAVIEGERIRRADMLQEIVDGGLASTDKLKELMYGFDPARKKAGFKLKNGIRLIDASLTKMETLAHWLDKGNVNGPFHRFIWNRIADAQTAEYDLHKQFTAKMVELLESLPKEYLHSLDGDPIQIPGTSRKWSHGQVLTMLLYSGQDVRRNKLVEGFAKEGLTHEGLDAAFARLTAEDVKLANHIWAIFDELRPLEQALEKRLTGVAPEWEGAKAFDIPAGHLTGGYFPLVADTKAPGTVKQKQTGGTVGELFDNGYMRARTSQSHTKELTGATYPLMLDYRFVLTAALANQIKDITHREAVLDINRIFKNQKFQEMVQQVLGEQYEPQFDAWLTHVVNERNAGYAAEVSGWSNFLTSARANSVAAMLGLKATTVFMQILDPMRVTKPGPGMVKGRFMTRGLMKFMAHPVASYREAQEKSGEMRHFVENYDRDMRTQFQKLHGDLSLRARWNRQAFKGLTGMAFFATTVAWHGSYEQAIADGVDEKTAVLRANETIRLKLQIGNPKDLPAALRGNEFMKLITMFMGDATANYTMMRSLGRGGLAKIPSFTYAGLMMMGAQMLAEMIRGAGPDDDEDELLWAVRKAMIAPTTMVPIMRDLGNAVDGVLEGNPLKAEYRFTPVLMWIDKGLKGLDSSIKLAKDEEEWTDWGIKMGSFLGYSFGIGGTSQAEATTKYLRRVETGYENPDNAAVLAFNAARGKRRER